MKRIVLMIVCSIGVLLILLSVLKYSFVQKSEPYHPSPFAVYENSSDLGQTVVVPTMDAKMPRSKNVIWCASFQLAWNHLGADVLHESPVVANAEEIVSQLNGSKFSENSLSSDCYFATAGRCSDGIVDKIHQEMQQRFQIKPKIDLAEPTNTIVAYGYLEASVPFRIPFFENHDQFIFHDASGKQTSVESFGIWYKHEYAYHRLREQIKVLYISREKYSKSENIQEFVIDPCKDSTPNQIVLARIDPRETLAATVEHIEKLIAREKDEYFNNEFGVRDVLLIPNMAWDITHHFSELEGKDKILLNKGYENNYIAASLQTIRFRLDRSGAELDSEAKIFCKPCSIHYIFDRAFVIYIKKRGETSPFFAMYIDNAELLRKSKSEAEKK